MKRDLAYQVNGVSKQRLYKPQVKHPTTLPGLKSIVGFLMCVLLFVYTNVHAQSRKPVYNPCLLADSVGPKLVFIQQNAWRIFTDTASCKRALLDSITYRYLATKDVKFIQALSIIRQNQYAKVEDYYTDIVNLLIENDFSGFIQQLYQARGRLAPLETEMIAALNMIVNGHPLKQKYSGLLNVEIEKAAAGKDRYKSAYLARLKQKIETDKYK